MKKEIKRESFIGLTPDGAKTLTAQKIESSIPDRGDL